jgi:hypothetical protein
LNRLKKLNMIWLGESARADVRNPSVWRQRQAA